MVSAELEDRDPLKRSGNDKLLGIVPLERLCLESDCVKASEAVKIPVSLDGSNGEFRAPNNVPKQISANDDLSAIREWLGNIKERNRDTWRSYRKESERLLMWAIIERNKPLSSLNPTDMSYYKEFLQRPLSIHPMVDWVAKTSRGKQRRWRRDQPEWRPFDGPLNLNSIDYTMTVIKCLFRYLNDVGYIQMNPLAFNKKNPVVAYERLTAKDRALDQRTWSFLYSFIESKADCIAPELDCSAHSFDKLRWLRTWYRAEYIFSALYLLGLRISELAAMRMSDFYTRDAVVNGNFKKIWWVRIVGKGHKPRDVPVPTELITVMAKYRGFLNTTPPSSLINRKAPEKRNTLSEVPNSLDDSTVVLSLSGRNSITTNRLQVIIKEVLAKAVVELERVAQDRRLKNLPPLEVDQQKLKKASAHWIRHTSAAQQGLHGISLRHRQKSLGHSSCDTTVLYDHINDNYWSNEVYGFRTK